MASLIANIYYNEPEIKDLAIGFAITNASSRDLMNYFYCIEKMKVAKIPIFTIEDISNGKKRAIKDAYHVSISDKDKLFNELEKRIPHTKIAFLDSNIIFNDPDWYTKLSNMLNSTSMVKCYKNLITTDITYRSTIDTKDTAYAWAFIKGSFNKFNYQTLNVEIYKMFMLY